MDMESSMIIIGEELQHSEPGDGIHKATWQQPRVTEVALHWLCNNETVTVQEHGSFKVEM